MAVNLGYVLDAEESSFHVNHCATGVGRVMGNRTWGILFRRRTALGFVMGMASVYGRNTVVATVREFPEQAYGIAAQIPNVLLRAQSFAWVARFASGDLALRAFEGARQAAAKGKDAYQRSAPLAWPIRAAIETRRLPLARSMFDAALNELPKISLYCTRADSIELVFPAAFPAGPDFRQPLLAQLQELCPVTSHWKCARLAVLVAGQLASEDQDAAQAFADALPACKARERILRELAGGVFYAPRPFFW